MAVEDDRSARDRALDETLEETFPASDAPANTVETGMRLDVEPADPGVVDNRRANRYEITVRGDTAVLVYERRPGAIALIHTEVPPALRGQHLGDRLAKTAIDEARAGGLRIIPICPFVKAYLQKHPLV